MGTKAIVRADPSVATRTNSPKTARMATVALLFGIVSPFGWIAGFFIILIYLIITASEAAAPQFDNPAVAVAMTLFSFVPPVIAFITGSSALKQIKRSGGTLKGKGRAISGIVLGGGNRTLCRHIALAVDL